MTNEEAIKHLSFSEIYTDDWEEAILMAKEAIEKRKVTVNEVLLV